LRRIAFLAFSALAAEAMFATPLFPSGELFWATKFSVELFRINGATEAARVARLDDANSDQFGQLAFTTAGDFAYATISNRDKVLRIGPDGSVTTFASGIKWPTGIAVDGDGRIFVATVSGRVYDATAGGDLSKATEYARGLSTPRNMLVTDSGILIAEQGSGEATLLRPGNLTNAMPFAKGLGDPTDFAVLGSRIYAVARGGDKQKAGRIFDITAGGDLKNATAFAWGQNFITLASTGGRLFASTDTREAGTKIWEVTGGGDFSSAMELVRIIAGSGDSIFEASPVLNLPVQTVPEPATLLSVGASLFGLAAMMRRRLR
jgi:hypothetical protein